MSTASLAFVGLGVMGFPMARHLAAAGHKVTVYNRTREKADAWDRSPWRQRRRDAPRGGGRCGHRVFLRRQ